MDINIYKNDYRAGTYLERIGIFDDASSVIWTRKYFTPGNFEIHIPNTVVNREMLSDVEKQFVDILVSIEGEKDAGIVEYMKIDEGAETYDIQLKGRFLSSMLDRHIIKGTYYANTIPCEQAAKEIIAFSPFVKNGIIARSNFAASGKKVTFQATYKNILSHLENVSGYSTCGFEIIPDFSTKKFIFNFYAGKDRTGADAEIPKAVFSEEYENINNAVYEFDKSNERTYEYVGGQGEGSARVIVQTGTVTDELLRKEKFYNASGEAKSDDDTDDQYKNRLTQKGNEDLEGYKVSAAFNCDTGADVNFTYGEDYDLGDIVLVKKSAWNMEKQLRITGITETYENGGRIISPTFGNPLPETINWEDN